MYRCCSSLSCLDHDSVLEGETGVPQAHISNNKPLMARSPMQLSYLISAVDGLFLLLTVPASGTQELSTTAASGRQNNYPINELHQHLQLA